MKNVNENSKIEALLKQIKTLEKELEDELKKDQKIFYDRIEKGKVIFEEEYDMQIGTTMLQLGLEKHAAGEYVIEVYPHTTGGAKVEKITLK